MTAEQKARDMIQRITGLDEAQQLSAGDVVELANLIEERDHLAAVVDFIGAADVGGELYPSGPSRTEYSEDGNTVIRHLGPWCFLRGSGDTFLAAVEDAMQKS